MQAAEGLTESRFGFDRQEFFDARQSAQGASDLANAGADFKDVTFEKMPKLSEQGSAVVLGSSEGVKLETFWSGDFVGGPGHKSAEEIVFENAPQGTKSVTPANLFALGVATPVVGNVDFVNPYPKAVELRSNFWLEAKAILFDGDLFDHLSPEHFIACLQVGEIEIGRHVGECGEDFIAYGMPVIEHTMRTRTHEARAEHHVGFAVEDGFEHARILCGIVFQIGVLNQHDRGCHFGKTRAQCGPFSLISCVS